jgi:hypothetical protein
VVVVLEPLVVVVLPAVVVVTVPALVVVVTVPGLVVVVVVDFGIVVVVVVVVCDLTKAATSLAAPGFGTVAPFGTKASIHSWPLE